MPAQIDLDLSDPKTRKIVLVGGAAAIGLGLLSLRGKLMSGSIAAPMTSTDIPGEFAGPDNGDDLGLIYDLQAQIDSVIGMVDEQIAALQGETTEALAAGQSELYMLAESTQIALNDLADQVNAALGDFANQPYPTVPDTDQQPYYDPGDQGFGGAWYAPMDYAPPAAYYSEPSYTPAPIMAAEPTQTVIKKPAASLAETLKSLTIPTKQPAAAVTPLSSDILAQITTKKLAPAVKPMPTSDLLAAAVSKQIAPTVQALPAADLRAAAQPKQIAPQVYDAPGTYVPGVGLVALKDAPALVQKAAAAIKAKLPTLTTAKAPTQRAPAVTTGTLSRAVKTITPALPRQTVKTITAIPRKLAPAPLPAADLRAAAVAKTQVKTVADILPLVRTKAEPGYKIPDSKGAVG